MTGTNYSGPNSAGASHAEIPWFAANHAAGTPDKVDSGPYAGGSTVVPPPADDDGGGGGDLAPPFITVDFPGYSLYWYGADGTAAHIQKIGVANNLSAPWTVGSSFTGLFLLAVSDADASVYDLGTFPSSSRMLLFTTISGPIITADHVSTGYINTDSSSAEIFAASGSVGTGTYVGGAMDFTGTPFEGLGTASITFA
jgi:hypothetical protein